MIVIRCSRCNRPFGSYAKRCPDCGWRSRYWFRSFFVRLFSIVGAVVALLSTCQMVRRHRELQRTQPPEAPPEALQALPPPQ
jgi:hypothetical protein